MSAEALLTGKLFQRAEERISKAGKPYVTARVRVPVSDAEAVFVNVICFSESGCAALLALSDGDSVSITGSIKPTAWLDRSSNPCAGLAMTASQVMSVYAARAKRKAATSPNTADDVIDSRGETDAA